MPAGRQTAAFFPCENARTQCLECGNLGLPLHAKPSCFSRTHAASTLVKESYVHYQNTLHIVLRQRPSPRSSCDSARGLRGAWSMACWKLPPAQYAHATVRLALGSLHERRAAHRVSAWAPSPSSPPFAVHLVRRPLRPLAGCMRPRRGPGRGLASVCRPHISRPGDHLHPLCANLRSPGLPPARWRVSATGRHAASD